MVPRESYIANLSIAEQVQDLPGCVVECGVWKGGMVAGIVSVLGPNRRYLLFDSFEGLPAARNIDGRAAIEWQNNGNGDRHFNNCAVAQHFAEEAMSLAGSTSFEIHKGWFEKTLREGKPSEPIALLRLDADWYDSTMTCLDTLFDLVSPGGLILVDDYYDWDGCSKALHAFLSKRGASERISSFGNVCYLIKN
jgi:hypothetical protein